MRIPFALRAALLGAICLSPITRAHAQAFPDMSAAQARAFADKVAADHAAAVRAAAARAAAARAAAQAPPAPIKLPDSKTTAHAQAFPDMSAAQARAFADKVAADHAAAVRAAAARAAAARAAALAPPAPIKLPDSKTAAHAQAFPNMGAAEAHAFADKVAANHAAAVRAAAARAAAARAAALAPPAPVKLPDSKTAAHAQAFPNMGAAEARAFADKVAANHAAAVRAAAARAAALAPPAPIKLPDFKTSEQAFAYARPLNDPEAAGVPFHLKATFFATGDAEFTGNGSYEEWWQSKNVWRKEATLGDYKYVAIQNGDIFVATASSVYTPLRVWQAMNLQLFQIGRTNDMQPDWKMSKIIVKGTPLLQVERSHPCAGENDAPHCLDRYIFSPSGVLKSYAENDLSQTDSNPQPFLQLRIPRRVVVALQENPLLALQIISLLPLSASDQALFDAKSLPHDPVIPAKVFSGEIPDTVILPRVISRAPMQFPTSQHGQIHSAIVVMECMIDPAGNVREPYIRISGGTDYDRQALKSLRQWKFAPGTLDGQPIVVKTVIVAGFSVKK